jgi:hypothetical protein
MAVVLFLLTFWLGTLALVRLALAPAVPPNRQIAANPPITVAAMTPPPRAAAPLPAGAPAKAADTSPPAAAPTAPPDAVPAAPPPPSAKDLAFAELQLQSIFYSQSNPSAIISGRQVRPRDRLPAGAVVVAIGPSTVTLEFENERRVLGLE